MSAAARQPRPSYAKAAVRAWFREYRAAPTIARRNAIVERFLPLVEATANRLAARLPAHLDRDEIAAFGMPGLIWAVEHFDPENANDAAFSNYATRRIVGSIVDEIRNLDHAPRLSRSRAAAVGKVARTFYAERGRDPTPGEIQQRLGIPDRMLGRVLRDADIRGMMSLAEPAHAGDGDNTRDVTIGGTLAARPDVEPGTAMDADAIVRDVVLPQYGLRMAILLKCYYLQSMTLNLAGDALRVSESRASQMHTDLMTALRGHFRTDTHAAAAEAA